MERDDKSDLLVLLSSLPLLERSRIGCCFQTGGFDVEWGDGFLDSVNQRGIWIWIILDSNSVGSVTKVKNLLCVYLRY